MRRVLQAPLQFSPTSRLIKYLVDNFFKSESWKFQNNIDSDLKFLKRALSELKIRSRRLSEYYVENLLKNKKPLSYILQEHHFISSNLMIRSPTLVPRSETEEWLQDLIKEIKESRPSHRKLRIVDFCSGSGCVGLEIAKNLNNVEVFSVEKYLHHIEIAKENANRNHIVFESKDSSFSLVKMDILKNCFFSNQQIDVIVSNPPYIPRFRRNLVQESVINWENEKALFTPKSESLSDSGLEFHRKILMDAKALLRPVDDYGGPRIVTEFDGLYQVKHLAWLAESCGFKSYRVKRDFNNQFRSLWVY